MRGPWEWRRRLLRLPDATEGEKDAPPCVVHLVRAANGLDSLRGFAQALRAHPPGIEHRLVLAMKGFTSGNQVKPYLAEVADLAPEVEFFPDRGFDLGLYCAAAERLRRGRYCFMNSHTRPAVDGWLAKLDAALDLPDAGIVGPSGSWSSFHSWIAYSIGLPSFYASVLPPVRETRRLLLEIDFEQKHIVKRSTLDSLRTRATLLAQVPEELLAFQPFPIPHLRTATVMISHAVLQAMRMLRVRNKMDTYALESGTLGMSAQVERMGLRTLVANSDGAAFDPYAWHRSDTLWQGQQERLLVRDNRTDSYALGDARRRRVLSALAWGHHATPSPPRSAPTGS